MPAVAESVFTKPQIIAALTQSPHGNLDAYAPIAAQAVATDPDFYAHLVAWNALKGQVRDAKVALPVLGLVPPVDPVHLENALAHLVALDPREFLRALTFARTQNGVSGRRLRRVVALYLRDLEAVFPSWERMAVQYRDALKTLYTRWHVNASPFARRLLVEGAAETTDRSRFGVIKALPTMPAEEAAEAIRRLRLPFLVVSSLMGRRLGEQPIMAAVIERMSPTDLVRQAKALKRRGVLDHPELRAVYERAIEAAARKPGRAQRATLKATKAADVVETAGDPRTAGLLRRLQERQLDALGGVSGRWLLLADRSGSMSSAVDLAKEIAAVLARMASNVVLIYYDTSPQRFEVSGKTLEEIRALTRHIRPAGGTDAWCGLEPSIASREVFDGIAIVSDGGENTPGRFAQVFERYCAVVNAEPTLYLYRVDGDADRLSPQLPGIMTVFDLKGQNMDYHSLPNLVQTMRTGRHSLTDEIYATPLVTLAEALPNVAPGDITRAIGRVA